MRAYIKKLKTKDEESRKQVLFITLGISMFIIGSIWIYGLTGRFDKKVQEQASADVKPFALFADSLSVAYKNITASVGNISSPKEETKKKIDLIVVDNSVNQ